MKDIVRFINEAKQSTSSINFEEFKDEIDALNEKFKAYTFAVFDDNGEHLYIHDKDSKKWYTAVPDKFRLDQWTIQDIVKTAPKLSETLYMAVKTFEIPDNRSRISGLMRHYVRPVLTHQGMFCNSEKECKQFIKAIKTSGRPDYGVVKKFKVTPMTIKEYTEFIEAETHKGEFYHYEHQDTQFIKYEA
jgi:hypothetical protein